MVASEEEVFVQELLEDPLFADEREWLNSKEARGLIEKVARQVGISEEEIFWISKDGKRCMIPAYFHHRAVLRYVIEQIKEQIGSESVEEIKSKFLKSLFTGELLTIAELVEAAFGKGGFRALGKMDKDDNSAIETLADLEERRKKVLEKK